MAFHILLADLSKPKHREDLVHIIDDYARQDIGGGSALSPEVREQLADRLRQFPTTQIFLAYEGEEAIGTAVCFLGFSTFAARPLLNIHDLAVLARARGQGVATALLQRAEERARELGCCKLTLEVLEHNERGRRLYAKMGFQQAVYRPEDGGALFYAKKLGIAPA